MILCAAITLGVVVLWGVIDFSLWFFSNEHDPRIGPKFERRK